MILLHEKKGRLSPVKEAPYHLEKGMQSMVEANLESLLGLELVRTEFTIKHRRIDTLAFDPGSRSFVIIEYKRSKSTSVVDQGVSYLQLMLDNKAEFIVEYNESRKATLRRSDVDWSQCKLIFVAPSFTESQLEATNFKDLNIGLMEIRRYAGDLFSVIHHTAADSAPSFKEVAQNVKGAGKVKQEIHTYTEADHLQNATDHVLALYDRLKTGILNIGDGITLSPKKLMIGFKVQRVFCDVEIQKKALKVVINMKKGSLKDPKGLTEDVSGKGHWGNGDYRVILANDTELEYLLSLIKQAFLKHT